jgi:hypothetical protein
MARPRKIRRESYNSSVIITKAVGEDLADLPLNTFNDYEEYNKKARQLGLPCKTPHIELHKHVRCKVTRLDGQDRNAIRIRKRSHLIDFDKTVMPSVEIELPECIVDFLHTLVYPQYKEVVNKDGSSETVFSHNLPRFAVQVLK